MFSWFFLGLGALAIVTLFVSGIAIIFFASRSKSTSYAIPPQVKTPKT